MAFGMPKIDVEAIRAEFNAKFAELTALLQAILEELRNQSANHPPSR